MARKEKKSQPSEIRFSEGFEGKYKVIPLKCSAQEYLSLCAMMKADEWENMSGFIKYKVFGTFKNGMDKTFGKLMDDLKSKDELLWLVSLVYPFVRQELDYVNFQYSKRLMEFDKLKPEDKKGTKMYDILSGWAKEIKGVTTEFLSLMEFINRKLEINVKAEDYNDVTSIPWSILCEYRRTHFDDTQSAVAMEIVRRNDLILKREKEEKEKDIFGFTLKKKLDELNGTLQEINRKLEENKEKTE